MIITFNNFLNQTKRVIYIQNCEFNEDLEKSLKEAYLFIENPIESIFVKSRNFTAVFLTFSLEEQPYTIYISGQASDTAVYKYKIQPMICHNCHKYGHKKTVEKDTWQKLTTVKSK